MRVESRVDDGLTNEKVKDGVIIFGGIALLIGTRGALRGGGREIGRQLEDMKPEIPEDASRFERTRFVLSRINLRLVGKEAGRGAIDEIKKVINGSEKKSSSPQSFQAEPIHVDFHPQTLSRAA